MIEFNGNGIVAQAIVADGTLIIGERYTADCTLVYVVALVPDGADEWVNGRYFDGGNARENRSAARTHFIRRVSEHWDI